MTPLRIAFMGTPAFSLPALHALAEAGHTVVAVYAQPPKPAGRGHHIQKSPIHLAAEAHGIPVHTPITLRDETEQKIFAALNLDIAVVAAYGLILPPAILNAPRYGCINIHASLLPRWRGAAPIQRAILAGDTETGITIMQMDAGLDTGAMLRKESLPITTATTASTLHDALSALGGQMIVPAVESIASGAVKPVAQSVEGVTYASKLTREDGVIEWQKPAEELERQIRALQPWPGCSFRVNNEPIKLLSAEIIRGLSGEAGTILDDQMTVACGKDALHLLSVQRAGKTATDGASFMRGARLEKGENLRRPISETAHTHG